MEETRKLNHGDEEGTGTGDAMQADEKAEGQLARRILTREVCLSYNRTQCRTGLDALSYTTLTFIQSPHIPPML